MITSYQASTLDELFKVKIIAIESLTSIAKGLSSCSFATINLTPTHSSSLSLPRGPANNNETTVNWASNMYLLLLWFFHFPFHFCTTSSQSFFFFSFAVTVQILFNWLLVQVALTNFKDFQDWSALNPLLLVINKHHQCSSNFLSSFPPNPPIS